MNKLLLISIACVLVLSSCDKHRAAKSVGSPVSEEMAVAAIQSSDTDSFQRYLNDGYPISGTDPHMKSSPAYWAVFYDRPEIIKILIARGLDINLDWGSTGGNLLTNAAQFGSMKVMNILLDANASTDRDPKLGRTPLYSAIIYDKKDAVALLRKHGAQLNQWDVHSFKTLGIVPPNTTEQGAQPNP